MKTVLDREDLAFDPPELGCVFCLSGLPGGGSIAYDRSPHGNHGNITGATWVRLSSGLWCLSFDSSDDWITVPHHSSVCPHDPLTVGTWDCWVYPINIGTVALFYKHQLEIGFSNQKLGFYDSGGLGWLFTDGVVEVEDVWQHVVCVKDGEYIYLYYNGSLDTTRSGAGNFALDTADLTIGGLSIPTRIFDGYLALPRIYNRPLSALEIQNHFNQEKHLFGVW